MTDIWHAEIYSTFLDMRTKPAKDLLFAIPESFCPEIVYDLGCGPGNSTVLLKQRWPAAQIIGLDSSADMLQMARKNYPEIEFIENDLTAFIPKQKLDCIFSNAALQWTTQHEILIPKLFSFLKPGGILAIQMPNNFHYPSHQVTIRLLENNPQWTHLLQHVQFSHLTSARFKYSWYYDLFSAQKASHIQLWETEYIQEMTDHQAIFNWVQGTGLRPILSKMQKADQIEFEKEYVDEITREYSLQKNGKVLMPFRRLFMVAMA